MQALLNTPFNYAITATGNPYAYGITPSSGTAPTLILPIGLQLNTITGFISGSPNTLGFYKFRVSATNAGGTGFQDFNLTVIPALVPVISSSSIASGTFNEPFTFTITANNSPLAYGIQGGALPTGLTLNDQTGVISGIPLQTGTFALTQTAANVAGLGTKPLAITINAPAVPVINSPLDRDRRRQRAVPVRYQGHESSDQLRRHWSARGHEHRQHDGFDQRPAEHRRDVQHHDSSHQPRWDRLSDIGPDGRAAARTDRGQSESGHRFCRNSFSYQIVASANPTSFSASGLGPVI